MAIAKVRNIVLILGLLIRSSGSELANAQPAQNLRPLELNNGSAAILDLSKTPVGALLEAKLLANNKRTWVERVHVDKVLAELEVQSVFSPEGGRKRVGLGKLLKAGVLVMLRAGEYPDDKKLKHVQIVVCETRYGLRLANAAVPLTGESDSQVTAMEAVIDGAFAKLSEKITDVCAVPPFLNNDLDFKYDHLKAAYARLLENHLLQRKGILLVELAEAQSIAKEASLAGDGTKLERWLPLYFLGAFRNEGTVTQHRVAFDLKLQRGDETVGSKQKVRFVPTDAVAAMCGFRWSDCGKCPGCSF
jgi:hypothetical protein